MITRPLLAVSATLVLALWAAAASPAFAADPAPDVARLLADADRFRVNDENLVIETRVQTVLRDGTPDKERSYTVYAQSGRRSLVLMRSPAEAGQKVLMLGDDFWLLMPASQRPMRITPSQKLLGDASTGDIATLRWAEDYAATLAGEAPCEAAGAAGAAAAANTRPCWHLSLTAQRKGVSYQRIELWIGKAHHEPVRADLYVQSDKMAKQASFVPDKPSGRPNQIDAMVLRDQLGNHKETRVQYLSRQKKVLPESWLNPMALLRNPGVE
jgi:hypothetical protein